MASGRLVFSGRMPAVDPNGVPYPDARMFFYVNRTTTLATVYADEALTAPLPNPVLADSAGQFVPVWADQALFFSASLESITLGKIESIDDLAPSNSVGGAANKLDKDGGNADPDFLVNVGAAAAIDVLPRVASITALRAVTWPNGRPARIVTTTSWATDDGEGIWTWDAASTATDNSGTIIKETATATGRWVRSTLNDAVVEWFGPTGTGADSTAWQRAIDWVLPSLGGCVVPQRRAYTFGTTVNHKSGVCIKGRGKAAWEPYNGAGSAFPNIGRTVITVDGIAAFNAANTNTARIEGVTIRGKDGGQSAYGGAPNFDAGSVGVDITSSSQFEMDDFALQGLANGVTANLTDGLPSAQMPSFTRWQASDCSCVYRFGTSGSTDYTIRDVYIGESPISLHCGRIVEAHWSDGLRLANLRLFQCNDLQVYIRRSVYVSLSEVTMFETTNENMIIETSETISIASLTCSRNGGYVPGSPPFTQKTSVRFNGCSNIAMQGVIRQCSGIAVELNDSTGAALDLAIDSPFWTTGSTVDGVIRLRNSPAVRLSGSFTTTDNRAPQATNFRYAVDADAVSSRTLSGRLSLPLDVATKRATTVQTNNGYNFIVPATLVNTMGILAIGTIRVYLEAGQRLYLRTVEIDMSFVQFRAVVGGTAVLWATTSDGRGTINTADNQMLFDNSVGGAGWKEIEAQLFNPTGVTVNVPSGLSVRVSTAIV